MVARLGAVTGVGHGRLIRERFGRYWGNLSIFSILFLNFLIIITEFIGISLSMDYFGVSPYVSVPVAVVLLFAVTASGSFRRWERFMMLFIAMNFLIIPLVILDAPFVLGDVLSRLRAHRSAGAPRRARCCSSSRSLARPSRRGSCSSSSPTSWTSTSRRGG